MKKKTFISLTVAAALSIGLAGCSRSDDVTDSGQAPATGKQTVTFVSGEETTRTSIGGAYTDATFPFYWEAGDKIWVNATDEISGNNTGTASHALFIGNVSTPEPYKIRYTGTGTYTPSNRRDAAYTFPTTSDANTLVIPPVQTISAFSKTDVSADNFTSAIGAIGDCGTATATPKGDGTYKFKLDHKAAYLILMPRWVDNAGNYMLKSVTVTTYDAKDLSGNPYLISGRFKFDDNGIGDCIYKPTDNTIQTNGSNTIKIITGSDGLPLPNTATTTDENGKIYRNSIIVAMKPVTAQIPLYCIYEVYDTNNNNTYYIEKIIGSTENGGTLGRDLSFAENSVTPVTADIAAGYSSAEGDEYLNLITNKNPYSGFYEWDAPVGNEYFVSHEMDDDYNASPISDGDSPTKEDGAKTDWCTNNIFNSLPTYNQITWYLKGGCYWDDSKKWGPGPKQHGGIWLKNRNYLFTSVPELAAETGYFYSAQSGTTDTTPVTTEPDDFSAGNWFFLPATGSYGDYDIGILNGVGTRGCYIACTPDNNNRYAYNLCFDSDDSERGVSLGDDSRARGFCLWGVQ